MKSITATAIRAIPVAALLIAGLSACRTDAPETDSNVAAVQPATAIPIILLAGGYSSCPKDGTKPGESTASKTVENQYHRLVATRVPDGLRHRWGTQPVFIMACFSGVPTLVKNLTYQMEFRYAWGTPFLNKDWIGTVRVGVPQGPMLADYGFMAYLKSDLGRFIDKQVAAGLEPKLYAIGHSYGGAVAINVASHFSRYLEGLATLDPIDPTRCMASSFLTQPHRTVTATLPGCDQAPDSPIMRSNIANIRGRLAKRDGSGPGWIHLYQDSFPFLHSGPILPASTRFPMTRHVRYSELKSIFGLEEYHTQIAALDLTWSEIERAFVE